MLACRQFVSLVLSSIWCSVFSDFRTTTFATFVLLCTSQAICSLDIGFIHNIICIVIIPCSSVPQHLMTSAKAEEYLFYVCRGIGVREVRMIPKNDRWVQI